MGQQGNREGCVVNDPFINFETKNIFKLCQLLSLKLPGILSGQINRDINKGDDSFGLQQVVIAELLFNPLSPNSDQNEISLYIFNTCSNIQVMRIKKGITKDEMS